MSKKILKNKMSNMASEKIQSSVVKKILAKREASKKLELQKQHLELQKQLNEAPLASQGRRVIARPGMPELHIPADSNVKEIVNGFQVNKQTPTENPNNNSMPQIVYPKSLEGPNTRREIDAKTALKELGWDGKKRYVTYDGVPLPDGLLPEDQLAARKAAQAQVKQDQKDIQDKIDKGTNLDQKDKDGITPLMKAAAANNPKLVKDLVDAGADPQIKNPEGATALNLADAVGATEVLKELGSSPEEPSSASASDDAGQANPAVAAVEKELQAVEQKEKKATTVDKKTEQLIRAMINAFATNKKDEDALAEATIGKLPSRDLYSAFASAYIFNNVDGVLTTVDYDKILDVYEINSIEDLNELFEYIVFGTSLLELTPKQFLELMQSNDLRQKLDATYMEFMSMFYRSGLSSVNDFKELINLFLSNKNMRKTDFSTLLNLVYAGLQKISFEDMKRLIQSSKNQTALKATIGGKITPRDYPQDFSKYVPNKENKDYIALLKKLDSIPAEIEKEKNVSKETEAETETEAEGNKAEGFVWKKMVKKSVRQEKRERRQKRFYLIKEALLNEVLTEEQLIELEFFLGKENANAVVELVLTGPEDSNPKYMFEIILDYLERTPVSIKNLHNADLVYAFEIFENFKGYGQHEFLDFFYAVCSAKIDLINMNHALSLFKTHGILGFYSFKTIELCDFTSFEEYLEYFNGFPIQEMKKKYELRYASFMERKELCNNFAFELLSLMTRIVFYAECSCISKHMLILTIKELNIMKYWLKKYNKESELFSTDVEELCSDIYSKSEEIINRNKKRGF